MEICNKVNLMRGFYTGDLVVVRKQVKSIRKDGVSQKQVLKIKGTYRFLENAKLSSYWIQCLHFCEGLGRPRRKVRESASRIEMILSTMVLHKYVYGQDTIFATTKGPLVKILWKNGLDLSEEGPTKQHMKIVGGHTNQCLIYGHIQSLILT